MVAKILTLTFFLFVNSLQTLSCGSCVGGQRFVVSEPVAGVWHDLQAQFSCLCQAFCSPNRIHAARVPTH